MQDKEFIKLGGKDDLVKDAAMESASRPGRKIRFIPKTKGGRLSVGLALGVGSALVLVLLLSLISGVKNSVKKGSPSSASNQVEVKKLATDNNSSGYSRSAAGDFSGYSLDLNFNQPAIISSKAFEAGPHQQVSWGNGFAILVASVDRDYRPASEFDYKKLAESGEEIVRVNFLIGNASSSNIAIGYNDLALYAEGAGMIRTPSERFSEDDYSPRDGQMLGAKQTQKVSLHYKVKRGQKFYVTKVQSIYQPEAKVKNGEEKNPTLSLKINLE